MAGEYSVDISETVINLLMEDEQPPMAKDQRHIIQDTRTFFGSLLRGMVAGQGSFNISVIKTALQRSPPGVAVFSVFGGKGVSAPFFVIYQYIRLPTQNSDVPLIYPSFFYSSSINPDTVQDTFSKKENSDYREIVFPGF
jgi:hypothetical protein